MIDHDIDPAFEDQLRAVLGDIAGRLEPTPPTEAAHQLRRRWVPAAAAVLIAVGVGGVAAVTARTSNDDVPPAATTSAPDPVEATRTRIVDRLLYPGRFDGDTAPEASVVEMSGTEVALLESPSGRQHQVRVGRIGATVLDDLSDRREVGGRTVVAERAEDGHAYQWVDQCVLGAVQTMGDDEPVWNDEDLALLDAIDVDVDQVTLTVPDGWTVFDRGASNPLIQLVFDVEIDGVTRTVVLGQSVGGSIAAVPPGLSRQFTPTDRVPGRAAWIVEGEMFRTLVFDNDGVAVGVWGDLTADELATVATQLAPRPNEWTRLLVDPMQSVAPGTTPPGAAPDVCGAPTLTIG